MALRIAPDTRSWVTLQEEQHAWRNRNFPDEADGSKPHRQLLGMMEELGELSEAMDAYQDDPGAVRQICDGAADFMIFTAGYCTDAGMDLALLVDMAQSERESLTAPALQKALLKWGGLLCHNHLKREHKIRGNGPLLKEKSGLCIARLIRALQAAGDLYGFDLEATTTTVWAGNELVAGVRSRDWLTHRCNGASA